MKSSTSIKLKAALLLMVFILNTIVSSACAMGVEMNFNSDHHHEFEGIESGVHAHENGAKHLHHPEAFEQNHIKNSHHKASDKTHKKTGEKDDCCNDEVRKFEQLAKAVPSSLSILHPVFFTTPIVSRYKNPILLYSKGAMNRKQFVRGHHPPIQDIRLAIQSFQI